MVLVAIILMARSDRRARSSAPSSAPSSAGSAPPPPGAIYSFGYTLIVGVIFNFIMGVTASRLMLKSISKFKPFKKAWLYGGDK